jgi:hypothetical protein
MATDDNSFRSAKPASVFCLILSLAACALRPVMVTGKFGESPVPGNGQIARLYLDSGDSLTARKIEQERDTLYITQMDYGLAAVATSRVNRITLMESDESEAPSGDRTKMTPNPEVGDNERIGWSVAQTLEIIGTVLGAIVIISFLL